jgi:hypothetical protein
MVRRPTVLSATAVVVVTEFACANRAGYLGLWWRFRVHTRRIVAMASGLTMNGLTTNWRQRRIVSVSCWESVHSVHSLGFSRHHVDTVRWAMRRGDIRTRSVVFESAGDWRSVLRREAYRPATGATRGAQPVGEMRSHE